MNREHGGTAVLENHEIETQPAAEPAVIAGVSRLRMITLPNGLDVACHTKTEAEFFYDDIFVKRIYHRNGIVLDPVQCVFDVGANIGLFTLFAHRYCPQARIFSFEPSPPTFEVLSHNIRTHAQNVKPFELGISDHEGVAELTHYLTSSGMSSLHADADEERRALEGLFESQQRQGVAGMSEVMHHREDLLEERLRSKSYEVSVAPLSKVIRDEHVERIDLLKIDVQKAEAAVLDGIDAADWPKIQQIVIEVHDIDGRLGQVQTDLENQGFSVEVEQDTHYDDSETYNLFAVRPGVFETSSATMPSVHDRANRLRTALGQGRVTPSATGHVR